MNVRLVNRFGMVTMYALPLVAGALAIGVFTRSCGFLGGCAGRGGRRRVSGCVGTDPSILPQNGKRVLLQAE